MHRNANDFLTERQSDNLHGIALFHFLIGVSACLPLPNSLSSQLDDKNKIGQIRNEQSAILLLSSRCRHRVKPCFAGKIAFFSRCRPFRARTDKTSLLVMTISKDGQTQAYRFIWYSWSPAEAACGVLIITVFVKRLQCA